MCQSLLVDFTALVSFTVQVIFLFLFLMYILYICFPFWIDLRILFRVHLMLEASIDIILHIYPTYWAKRWTQPSHTPLDPCVLCAQTFLEIRGWYAEKLYVTLRYQVLGEPVLCDGSRDPSFRSRSICVCWLGQGPLSSRFPVCFKTNQDFTLMFLSTGNNDV